MSLSRRLLGRRSERKAARYLRRRGLRVLARNVATRHGEVDLVCLDGDTLVFVEVRAVASAGGPEDALDAVTPGKARQVVRAARAWLDTRAGRRLLPRDVRFDVVAVDTRRRTVEHVEDAFRAPDEAGFFSG